MCYQKQRGSGTLTAVASAEGDMLVAAAVVVVELVAQPGMSALVLGCMASAVVPGLVGESDTVYAAAAPLLCIGTEELLMATVVAPHAKVHCMADWMHCE